mmetsp:Transcript_53730/g.165331  ORF Transcript_53730/g.165331 Transcript_53730/m.165331 type:complete len:227 (+) Transcript_53730:151-831(+)
MQLYRRRHRSQRFRSVTVRLRDMPPRNGAAEPALVCRHRRHAFHRRRRVGLLVLPNARPRRPHTPRAADAARRTPRRAEHLDHRAKDLRAAPTRQAASQHLWDGRRSIGARLLRRSLPQTGDGGRRWTVELHVRRARHRRAAAHHHDHRCGVCAVAAPRRATQPAAAVREGHRRHLHRVGVNVRAALRYLDRDDPHHADSGVLVLRLLGLERDRAGCEVRLPRSDD